MDPRVRTPVHHAHPHSHNHHHHHHPHHPHLAGPTSHLQHHASARSYALQQPYGYEGRYSLPSSRQPLQESTGNAQHGNHSLTSSRASYTQQLDAFNLVRSSIHTPPIIPTQALPAAYRGIPSSSSASSYRRLQQGHPQPSHQLTYRRSGINPLCLSRQFQQYRTKQAQKEDKSDQTWPDVLEDAFLDALLLIPHMGRKKYGMNQKQCGRNMLITDYLWIAYCESLPPGVMPDPKMKRHRKQVSSHIQVLKGFFRHHPMYHIFFSKEEKKDDKSKDTVETASLKDHPVLRALAEGRLPEERPNYDYFAQLLAFESQIAVKPKRCWIFVSHNDVVVRPDGSGYLPSTGEELSADDYPHLRENLAKETWPREDKAMLPGALLHRFTKALEQVESSSVRDIHAQWNGDFPELASRLDAALGTSSEGGGGGGAGDAGGPSSCDILHMHLTLELQRRRHFPGQSELNSWVEINVEQPHLLHHRWKVVTRLARPAELARGSSGDGGGSSSTSSSSSPSATLYETTAEMGVQYVHQPRCDAPLTGRGCDCVGQSQRQVVSVPFPADVWARTLTNCAEYPAHPLVLDRAAMASAAAAEGKEGKGAAPPELDEHEEKSIKSKIKKHLTQMELVPKIAMLQEVWSCPPAHAAAAPQEADFFGGGGGGSSDAQKRNGSGKWKRRALLLWTFETVHSVNYTLRGRNELVTAPEGKGQWRFLTTLDPTSQYHQKRSLLSASAVAAAAAAEANANANAASLMIPTTGHGDACVAASHHHQQQQQQQPQQQHLSRDAVMSPTPSFQQQLHASMSENFALAWDSAGDAAGLQGYAGGGSLFAHPQQPPQQHPHPHPHQHQAPSSAGGLDSFSSHNGLTTPPPTASLAGSFTHGFGGGGGSASSQQQPHGHPHAAAALHHADVSHHAAALDFMAAVTSAGMDASLVSVADHFLSAAGGGGGGGGGGSGIDAGHDSQAAAAAAGYGTQVYDEVHGGGGGGVQSWDMGPLSAMEGRSMAAAGPWSSSSTPTGYGPGSASLEWPAPPSVPSPRDGHGHASDGGGAGAGTKGAGLPSPPAPLTRSTTIATLTPLDEPNPWTVGQGVDSLYAGLAKPGPGGQDDGLPSEAELAAAAGLSQQCLEEVDDLVPEAGRHHHQAAASSSFPRAEPALQQHHHLDPSRRKGLKRSWTDMDHIGDRENHPPHQQHQQQPSAKLARLSTTPTAELDWHGVHGGGLA